MRLTRRDGRIWIGAVLLAALAACTQVPPAQDDGEQGGEPAGASDLVLASALVGLPQPGVGPGDLPDPESEGAQHLRQYCTACHALPGPQTHSATDWPVVLRRMWMRIDGLDPKYAVPIPTAGERVVLMRYVLGNALQVSRAELPSGQGRQLYMTECSRCHELPDPRQHTANDWPAVVIRMREHSVQMLRRSPPQSQVQEIILYLERASRAGT